jgi:hypothetical protein
MADQNIIQISVGADSARKSIQRINELFPGVIDAVVKETGVFCTRTMMERTPVRTGHARRGWAQPKKIENAAYLVLNTVPYVGLLDTGSKPHEIRAKNKQALFFKWNGVPTFVPLRYPAARQFWDELGLAKKAIIIKKGYVNHPGTKGRPFIKQVKEETQRYMERRVVARFKDLLAMKADS